MPPPFIVLSPWYGERMSKQPEGKLVKRIRRYLEGRGAWVFNVHGGDNPFQEVGIPDLIVCLWGRFIVLEVKQPGEAATTRQKYVIRKIQAAGGIAAVVDSITGVEAVINRLERTLRK